MDEPWIPDTVWDHPPKADAPRLTAVYDSEFGALVELTDADGNRFYGFDPVRDHV